MGGALIYAETGCLWYCVGLVELLSFLACKLWWKLKGKKWRLPLCRYFMLGLVLIFHRFTFLLGVHYLPSFCLVFFFLNKDFFNELGFAACKGREIRLFTKLLDHRFSIDEISMLCVQLTQSFRKVFSLNRKFWAFSCVNWNHLTPKYLPFAVIIDKSEHHIAYAICFIEQSYLFLVSLGSFHT